MNEFNEMELLPNTKSNSQSGYNSHKRIDPSRKGSPVPPDPGFSKEILKIQFKIKNIVDLIMNRPNEECILSNVELKDYFNNMKPEGEGPACGGIDSPSQGVQRDTSILHCRVGDERPNTTSGVVTLSSFHAKQRSKSVAGGPSSSFRPGGYRNRGITRITRP